MKAIATFGTGYHQQLLEVSLPAMRRFAERHGYEVFVGDPLVDGTRPVSWYKIPMLLDLLLRYDEVLWLDADVVIVDGTADFDIPADCLQAMVFHHTPDGEVPNCGVWLMRKGIEPMLKEAWKQTDLIWAAWWEQSAILRLMGYAESARPCKLEQPTEWYRKTYRLGNEWNSHPWDEHPQPKIRHATMYKDRLETMRQWAREAK